MGSKGRVPVGVWGAKPPSQKTFKIQYAETLFYEDHESPVVPPPQPPTQQHEQQPAGPASELASAAHHGLLSTTPTAPTSSLRQQDATMFDLGFESDIR